jgi:hypothetical protein
LGLGVALACLSVAPFASNICALTQTCDEVVLHWCMIGLSVITFIVALAAAGVAFRDSAAKKANKNKDEEELIPRKAGSVKRR